MLERAWALSTAVACLLVAAPAWSQDDWDDDFGGDDESEVDRGRESVYLSFRGLYAVDVFDGDPIGRDGRSIDRHRLENSWGADGRIGYRFGPLLALEGQFEWINNFDYVQRVQPPGEPAGTTRTSKIEGYTGTVNARAYLWSGQVQPYAVAGVGVMYMEQRVQTPFKLPFLPGQGVSPLEDRNDVGPAVRVGVGFEVYGFENDTIAFTFESSYVAGFGDVWDYHYLSNQAGLLFRW